MSAVLQFTLYVGNLLYPFRDTPPFAWLTWCAKGNVFNLLFIDLSFFWAKKTMCPVMSIVNIIKVLPG